MWGHKQRDKTPLSGFSERQFMTSQKVLRRHIILDFIVSFGSCPNATTQPLFLSLTCLVQIHDYWESKDTSYTNYEYLLAHLDLIIIEALIS